MTTVLLETTNEDGQTVLLATFEQMQQRFKPKLTQKPCECPEELLHMDNGVEMPFWIPSTGMDVPYEKRGGKGTKGCKCGYEVGNGFPRWAYEHMHCGKCGGIAQWG